MEKVKISPIKQRDGSFAVVIANQIMNVEELKRFVNALEKYGVKVIKFSESQRMVLVGIGKDQIDKFCEEAGVSVAPATGRGVRSIKFCPGKTLCVFGLQETIPVAQSLQKFSGVKLPDKLKIAISGCPNSCTEPAVRDIGFMGQKDGFVLFVGGSAGKKPRIGVKIAEKIKPEEVPALVERILEVYSKEGKGRIGEWLEHYGIDNFKKKIGL